MYNYIEGMISEINVNNITIDNNGIGYLIYTANPYKFNVNEKYKVYVYQHIRDDENTLYGFNSDEEKKLFLKLIGVKGLGPKMALPILATGSIDGIITAIEEENVSYLKKFPKIGDKVSRQIILDLKGKLVSTTTSSQQNEEVIEALKALGYKQSDIDKLVPKLNRTLSIENQIKEALKLLLK